MQLAKRIPMINLKIKKVLAAGVLTCGLSMMAHADWPQLKNGANNNFDQANDITVDSAGNVYMLGTIDNGTPTGLDMLTVKYSKTGTQQWAYTWNSDFNANDYAVGLALDNQGHVVVTGYSAGEGPTTDIITMGINQATGAVLWAHGASGPFGGDDMPVAIACDSQGNSFVTGETQTANFGTDYITVKYNVNGSEQWIKTYSGPGDNADQARAIAVDVEGFAYVTGRVLNGGNYYDYGTIKYAPNGDVAWVRTYNGVDSLDDPAAIAVDNFGDVVVTGTSDGPSFTSDVLTVKYSTSGTKLWQTRVGTGNIYETGKDLVIDGDRNIYVCGTSGTDPEFSDVLTFKLNSSGVKQWSKIYTSKPKNFSADVAVGIDLDGNNNVFVAAAVRENNDNAGTKYGLLKYTSAGAQVYAKTFAINEVGPAVPTALAVDRTLNKAYVTGYAYSSETNYFDIATMKF